MIFNRKKNNINTFKLYISLILKWGRSQKKNFIIANILMILVAAVTSLYPIAIDFAFNAINNKNLKDLMYIPIFIIILTVAKGISYFYQTIYVGKISNSVIKEIQLNLYNKVVNFDILLMGQFKQGSLQSRFINDLNILREAITRILNNLIRDLFTLFGLLISMIYLDWLLTLCVILIYPLCIKPIIFIGKSTRKHSLKLQEKIASAGAFLSESFSSIAVIKTFNLEGLQKKKAEKKFSDIYRKNIEIIRVRSKVEPTLEIIGGLAISSVIVIPDANPKICVCIAAEAALLHTSLLLMTTLGALAVGGALSVTTVEDTVFVSAAHIVVGINVIKAIIKKALIYLISFLSIYIIKSSL
mgnify:CR=1 FL=1